MLKGLYLTQNRFLQNQNERSVRSGGENVLYQAWKVRNGKHCANTNSCFESRVELSRLRSQGNTSTTFN